MKPLISVITIGKERTQYLIRCIDSIKKQTYNSIEHLIIADECEKFHQYAQDLTKNLAHTRVLMHKSKETVTYKPARAAYARNLGIYEARGKFIAFLDDDNSWEPDHLTYLANSLSETIGAAYSLRTLWTADEKPYTSALHPWNDTKDAVERYHLLVKQGIYQYGTNYMHDKYFIDDHSIQHCTVDTSAWLILTQLAKRYPFPVNFSLKAQQERHSEDAQFGIVLAQHTSVVTSNQFTLRYYLGGFSTDKQGSWEL